MELDAEGTKIQKLYSDYNILQIENSDTIKEYQVLILSLLELRGQPISLFKRGFYVFRMSCLFLCLFSIDTFR